MSPFSDRVNSPTAGLHVVRGDCIDTASSKRTFQPVDSTPIIVSFGWRWLERVVVATILAIVLFNIVVAGGGCNEPVAYPLSYITPEPSPLTLPRRTPQANLQPHQMTVLQHHSSGVKS